MKYADQDSHPLPGESLDMVDCEDAQPSRGLSEPLSLQQLLSTTCGVGGLQVLWSTIMANLPLVLHSLGIPKAVTSIVLMSQPLAGCLVGPVVGSYSDRLRTEWGRRRPMIVAGAVATSTCLIILAWLEDGVGWLTCKGELCGDYEAAVRRLVQVLAILWTLALSVAIQPLQSGIRSLMVDRAPASQQSRVSAWASRLAAIGGIFGFLASSTPLPEYLPFAGNITQFQALALLDGLVLVAVTSIICLSVDEADSRDAVFEVSNAETGLLAIFLHLRITLRNLPQRILAVCKVQCCAWFAWFSVLYYTTSYISELAQLDAPLSLSLDQYDHGAQPGSFVSFCFAIVALVAILILPELAQRLTKSSRRLASLEAKSGATDSLRGLTYLSMASQIWLGLSLLVSPLVSSQLAGAFQVALLGLSWAVTQWVPFAIIGVELQQTSGNEEHQDEKHDSAEGLCNAGTVLGIYNMAISLPQIGAALIDGMIYLLAEAAGSGKPTAWIFALGSLPAFAASLLARRLC